MPRLNKLILDSLNATDAARRFHTSIAGLSAHFGQLGSRARNVRARRRARGLKNWSETRFSLPPKESESANNLTVSAASSVPARTETNGTANAEAGDPHCPCGLSLPVTHHSRCNKRRASSKWYLRRRRSCHRAFRRPALQFLRDSVGSNERCRPSDENCHPSSTLGATWPRSTFLSCDPMPLLRR